MCFTPQEALGRVESIDLGSPLPPLPDDSPHITPRAAPAAPALPTPSVTANKMPRRNTRASTESVTWGPLGDGAAGKHSRQGSSDPEATDGSVSPPNDRSLIDGAEKKSKSSGLGLKKMYKKLKASATSDKAGSQKAASAAAAAQAEALRAEAQRMEFAAMLEECEAMEAKAAGLEQNLLATQAERDRLKVRSTFFSLL